MRLLADATALDDPRRFREDEIAEAVDHLEKACDAAPEGSDAAEAVHVALACLEVIDDIDGGTDQRRQNVGTRWPLSRLSRPGVASTARGH